MQRDAAEALIKETSDTVNVLLGTGTDNIDSSKDESEPGPPNTAENQGICKCAQLHTKAYANTQHTLACHIEPELSQVYADSSHPSMESNSMR